MPRSFPGAPTMTLVPEIAIDHPKLSLPALSVGVSFACRLSCIRSLGDLRSRQVEGDRSRQEAKFWDVETPRFALVEGPAWLRVDEDGTLRGIPDAAGVVEVVVRVTLEKDVRRLNEARLAWGHEVPVGADAPKPAAATRRFRLTVR